MKSLTLAGFLTGTGHSKVALIFFYVENQAQHLINAFKKKTFLIAFLRNLRLNLRYADDNWQQSERISLNLGP